MGQRIVGRPDTCYTTRHRHLSPDMLSLFEPRDDRAYLQYTEHGSKNNPGGLRQRGLETKTVRAYANLQDPQRCLIRLYKYYMSLRPHGAPDDAFYLQPLRTWSHGHWYQCRPVGHNPLGNTVKRLFAKAGIEGNFTNHSLRCTCATRLFQKGIEEKVIMSVTGHKSTDGIRRYQTISSNQKEAASDVIQLKRKIDEEDSDTKKIKIDEEKENVKPKNNASYSITGCTVNIP